jgi:hypothetical protein
VDAGQPVPPAAPDRYSLLMFAAPLEEYKPFPRVERRDHNLRQPITLPTSLNAKKRDKSDEYDRSYSERGNALEVSGSHLCRDTSAVGLSPAKYPSAAKEKQQPKGHADQIESSTQRHF